MLRTFEESPQPRALTKLTKLPRRDSAVATENPATPAQSNLATGLLRTEQPSQCPAEQSSQCANPAIVARILPETPHEPSKVRTMYNYSG